MGDFGWPPTLPRGLHKVRYYGWWRPQATATRTRLEQQIAPPSPSPRDDVPDVHVGSPPAPCCPKCSYGHLLRTRRLLRVPSLARPP